MKCWSSFFNYGKKVGFSYCDRSFRIVYTIGIKVEREKGLLLKFILQI